MSLPKGYRRKLCMKGLHDLSNPANVRLEPNGSRRCRICANARARRYYRKGRQNEMRTEVVAAMPTKRLSKLDSGSWDNLIRQVGLLQPRREVLKVTFSGPIASAASIYEAAKRAGLKVHTQSVVTEIYIQREA